MAPEIKFGTDSLHDTMIIATPEPTHLTTITGLDRCGLSDDLEHLGCEPDCVTFVLREQARVDPCCVRGHQLF